MIKRKEYSQKYERIYLKSTSQKAYFVVKIEITNNRALVDFYDSDPICKQTVILLLV